MVHACYPNFGSGNITSYFWPQSSGNYSLCVGFSGQGNSTWNITECVSFYVNIIPPTIEIGEPTNQTQIQTNVSTMNINYTVSNYSGSISWIVNKTGANQAQNGKLISRSWNYPVNYTETVMNTTIPILSESGSYLICALLVQANLTDCTTFEYILPPAQVSIIYPMNNSVIDEPTYHWYYNTDYVSIQSSISNYTGYLTQTVLSSDDVDDNGTISIVNMDYLPLPACFNCTNKSTCWIWK